MLTDPGAWDALLGRLARAIALYLNAQIAAGAQLVQLFDSWVGCLGDDDYRRYVLPYSRQVISEPHPRRTGHSLRHRQSGPAAGLCARPAGGRDRRRLAHPPGRAWCRSATIGRSRGIWTPSCS